MKVLRTIVLLGLVAIVEVAVSVTGVMAAARLIAARGWLGWLLCLPVLVGTTLLAVGAKVALCAPFFPRKEEPV